MGRIAAAACGHTLPGVRMQQGACAMSCARSPPPLQTTVRACNMEHAGGGRLQSPPPPAPATRPARWPGAPHLLGREVGFPYGHSFPEDHSPWRLPWVCGKHARHIVVVPCRAHAGWGAGRWCECAVRMAVLQAIRRLPSPDAHLQTSTLCHTPPRQCDRCRFPYSTCNHSEVTSRTRSARAGDGSGGSWAGHQTPCGHSMLMQAMPSAVWGLGPARHVLACTLLAHNVHQAAASKASGHAVQHSSNRPRTSTTCRPETSMTCSASNQLGRRPAGARQERPELGVSVSTSQSKR